MATEKLSKAAVAERALRLGDEEGLEAVTIRRLAQALGVTPMALYWHFKNKDELLVGVVDHVLSGVRADRNDTDPWTVQLRAMVETLVTVLRAHPILADLLHAVEKGEAASFSRATNDALALLTQGGFSVQEGYWVASYLLHGAIGLIAAQPDCPPLVPPEQAGEWRRQQRLKMERLPADQFPMLVAFAATYQDAPDPERYFRFGIDLLMAGVEAAARTRAAGKVETASGTGANGKLEPDSGSGANGKVETASGSGANGKVETDTGAGANTAAHSGAAGEPVR